MIEELKRKLGLRKEELFNHKNKIQKLNTQISNLKQQNEKLEKELKSKDNGYKSLQKQLNKKNIELDKLKEFEKKFNEKAKLYKSLEKQIKEKNDNGKNILFVEGKTDEIIFSALLKKINKTNIKIIQCNGVNQFPHIIEILCELPPLSKIGIMIFDNDNAGRYNLKAINKIIKNKKNLKKYIYLEKLPAPRAIKSFMEKIAIWNKQEYPTKSIDDVTLETLYPKSAYIWAEENNLITKINDYETKENLLPEKISEVMKYFLLYEFKDSKAKTKLAKYVAENEIDKMGEASKILNDILKNHNL